MTPSIEQQANAKVLAALSTEGVPQIAYPQSVKGPYMGQGCHPDIVERIWDQIGKVFDREARCLVYGRPALVEPDTGIIVAVGYGTAYCVRIPVESIAKAIELGAHKSMKWSGGKTTDIEQEFGDGWVFGAWLKEEQSWCQQAAAELGG